MVEIAKIEERPDLTRDEEYAEKEERGIVPRNKRGQPMIWLPDGSKRVAYSRPSGLGDPLDDKQNLFPWHRGRALIGAMRNDKLLDPLREADARGVDWDEQEGKEISKKQGEIAFKVGGGEDRAERGTLWHEVLEEIDHGGDPFVPEEYEPFVEAYKAMMAEAKDRYGLQIVGTEIFGVADNIKIAGTLDVLMTMNDPETHKRMLLIGDKKTSRSLDHSMGKFACQLWAYSQMVRYDPRDALHKIATEGYGVGRKRMLKDTSFWVEPTASSEVGFIFWTPSGRAIAEMVPLDISQGARGYALAQEVKEWRNHWNRKAQEPVPLIKHTREETA